MSELSLILQSVVLGLVQGVSEFLPISSSAHLVIIPEILGWPYLGKAFDVALHFGTLLALLVVFHKDVKAILRGFRNILRSSPNAKRSETQLAQVVLIASIPVGVLGLAFELLVKDRFEGLIYVASMLILWGILMGVADRSCPTRVRSMDNLSLREALFIGLAQAAALIPGTSRSGSTITAALCLGFPRSEAARFSFLLSLPVVVGASFLKAIQAVGSLHSLNMLGPVLVGTLVSAISGYFCIKTFLRYLENNSFKPFVIYRILLGVFLIYWSARG